MPLHVRKYAGHLIICLPARDMGRRNAATRLCNIPNRGKRRLIAFLKSRWAEIVACPPRRGKPVSVDRRGRAAAWDFERAEFGEAEVAKDIEARVAVLEAREAIKEQRARYGWHIARGHHEAVANLFTPDGVYESLQDGKRERCDGREAILSLLRRMLKPAILYPMLHNHIIEVDGDLAWGSCAMEARLAPELGQGFAGYYLDRLARQPDGGWLFTGRLWYLYTPVFEENDRDEYGNA
jgi:hypothetical protein